MFVVKLSKLHKTQLKGNRSVAAVHTFLRTTCVCAVGLRLSKLKNKIITINTDFFLHMLDVFNEPCIRLLWMSWGPINVLYSCLKNAWNWILQDILLVRTQPDAFANSRSCYDLLVEVLNVKLRKTVQLIHSLFLPLFMRLEHFWPE